MSRVHSTIVPVNVLPLLGGELLCEQLPALKVRTLQATSHCDTTQGPVLNIQQLVLEAITDNAVCRRDI